MTTGRFHGETGNAIAIRAGEVRDIPLRVDGMSGTAWHLPVGDTDFDIQLSDITLPATGRPTRIIVDIVRGNDDRTARCTRAVAATGDRKWADVFGGQEYVNEDDGLFRFRVQHDGTATVVIGKVVVKGVNERALTITALGGYCRWSDGTIR